MHLILHLVMMCRRAEVEQVSRGSGQVTQVVVTGIGSEWRGPVGSLK